MGDIGELNEILSRRDCQIIPLSYTSQFGFVFNMIYQDKTEILKTYILVDSNQSSEGRDFDLPNYIDVNLENESKGKKFNAFDEAPGHLKKMETISNFTKEAQIQREVYNVSINNSPLCPEIYGSYIVYNVNSHRVLELFKQKCQENEGKKMIQYLENNINSNSLGIIRMEYAEGYTTFREAEKNQTLYENVIYANIRLLMETGYLHLDLNPGNVMVRRDEVLLIDFGKSKSIDDIKNNYISVILGIIKKKSLESNDINNIIDFINYFDRNENDKSLFQQNFVSKLSNREISYQKIAEKLNKRTNKTSSPKYGELQAQPQNTAVSSNSSPINSVFRLSAPSSPPSNKRGFSLFGDETPPKRRSSSDSDSENIPPNIFRFGTPPTTPRGGAKKSKKTKRKPIHNKRTSKKRQNKKRVKLISNK